MRVLLAASALLLPALFHAQFQVDLDEIMSDFNLMGMSVVTVCDGEVQEVYHGGLKDATRTLQVDDSTMYRIASVSKTITATGMMLLYDQGLFEWETDISDILGYEVRNPIHQEVPITVEMVLSHRSSLQDGSGYNDFLGVTYASSSPPNISELIVPGGDYYTANMWRTEAPGTFFAYSNINFGLVATLMEKLSGQRFDIFMREQLFEPMGLAGSYNVADIANIDNLAVLYRNQGGWTPQVDNYQGEAPAPVYLPDYEPGTNGSYFGPQGGLRMSALDLAKLMQLHIDNGLFEGQQLIQTSTMAAMRTPLYTYDGTNGDNYYGLFRSWGRGIQRVTNTPNGDVVLEMEMWGHPGEAYGLISDWYYEPDTGYGVIFMTNGAYDGFSFGEYSAFYTLEEAVFEAVIDNALGNCTVNVPQSELEAPVVAPNPADDVLGVKPRTPFWKRWLIRDAQGRVLATSDNPGGLGSFHIDVRSIPTGMYVLELHTEHEKQAIRWVKS